LYIEAINSFCTFEAAQVAFRSSYRFTHSIQCSSLQIKIYLFSSVRRPFFALLAIVVLVWFSLRGGYEPPDHQRVGQLRPIENVKTLIFIHFGQLEKHQDADCDHALVCLLLFESDLGLLSRQK